MTEDENRVAMQNHREAAEAIMGGRFPPERIAAVIAVGETLYGALSGEERCDDIAFAAVIMMMATVRIDGVGGLGRAVRDLSMFAALAAAVFQAAEVERVQ